MNSEVEKGSGVQCTPYETEKDCGMITHCADLAAVCKQARVIGLSSCGVLLALLACSIASCRRGDGLESTERVAEVRRMMNAAGKESGSRYDDVRGPLTPAEVEQEVFGGPMDASIAMSPPLRDMLKDTWIRLKSSFEEGDELYFFRSDKESWSRLSGQEGYVLVRKDRIVSRFVTVMN